MAFFKDYMKFVLLEYVRGSLSNQRIIDREIEESASLSRNIHVIIDAIENNAFSRIRARHIEVETTAIEEQKLPEFVTIGDQVWMSENLNVSRFRNGDVIPEVQTDEQWELSCRNKMPACCLYDNDPANEGMYGKLYNWYAVRDPRGLAPEGWHVPSDEEWTRLADGLGGESVAGRVLKSSTGWVDDEGRNGNGTNSASFNGHPGGHRYHFGAFAMLGFAGYWWSSSAETSGYPCYRQMSHNDHIVWRDYDNYKYSGFGFSVRCVRD